MDPDRRRLTPPRDRASSQSRKPRRRGDGIAARLALHAAAVSARRSASAIGSRPKQAIDPGRIGPPASMPWASARTLTPSASASCSSCRRDRAPACPVVTGSAPSSRASAATREPAQSSTLTDLGHRGIRIDCDECAHHTAAPSPHDRGPATVHRQRGTRSPRLMPFLLVPAHRGPVGTSFHASTDHGSPAASTQHPRSAR